MKNIFFSKSSSSYSKDTIDILRLIRSENVGPKTFVELVKLFGSASIALDNISEFAIKGGRSKPIKIYSQKEAEDEISKLNDYGGCFLTYKDSRYPELLRQMHDFPPIISYKGNIELMSADTKRIAVVGARNASLNGKIFTRKIIKELLEHGFYTVSGLARGIDAEVHSVDTTKTIAVIAGGIDHIYPLENTKLFEEIWQNGLIIAELPIGSKPLSQNFPQRNRIISGISCATVVIEASLKSGSLITANFALEQNREVFAVPGFPLDPRCMGTNQLIKQGAHLLENIDDILNNISSLIDKNDNIFKDNHDALEFYRSAKLQHNIKITEDERRKFLELLSGTPVSLDILAKETSLTISEICVISLEFELAGKILRHPGNRVSRIY